MGKRFRFDGRKGVGGEPNQGVPETQIDLSLGGAVPASDPKGFGPGGVGEQYAASLPKTLDPFAADPFVGGRVMTPSGKQVHGQLPAPRGRTQDVAGAQDG